MSERSKKKIIYTLVVVSVGLNLLLMVNVFALKIVSRRWAALSPRPAATLPQAPALARPAAEEMTAGKKNLLQTSYELAGSYERKGDKSIDMRKQTDFYSLALLEYAKLPNKNPRYSRLVRQARERIQPRMLENSSLLIALGDTRRQVERVYGKSDRRVIDRKYLPSGAVSYDYYREQGLVVGISLGRVFSIKFRSDSPGLWRGIRIGDHFDKLKTLYKGKRVYLPGNHFGYRVDELKTTFIFVDGDEKLDGIKIADQRYYGMWEQVLK